MWNVPYQRCIESGLFIIKESVSKNADGTEFISRTPMVTGKGQRYFISKFLETKDEEALAAISEEELRLQREDNLFASGNVDYGNNSNYGDYKPQLTVEELNALDAQAKEVAAALSEVDDLEPLNQANNELESINDAVVMWDFAYSFRLRYNQGLS